MEGAMFGVFFVGGWLAYGKKQHKVGCRLMAISALCAFILAGFFVFSPDAPIIIKSSSKAIIYDMGGWVDSLVKEVLGG
jgi:hypothetical protein